MGDLERMIKFLQDNEFDNLVESEQRRRKRKEEAIEEIYDFVEKRGLIISVDEDDSDADVRFYYGYSGRGMYGDHSSVAVSTADWVDARDVAGLYSILGNQDNLGLGYILYTRW